MKKLNPKMTGAPVEPEPVPTETRWVGLAKMSTGEIVAVRITDLSGNSMPFGSTAWLEAIEGESEALAVIENMGAPATVVDCGSDSEAPSFSYHYD